MSFKLHQTEYTKQRCPTLGNSVYLGPHNVNGYIIHLRCRNLRQDHMMMSEKPGPFRRREQYPVDVVVLAPKKTPRGPHPLSSHAPLYRNLAAFVKDVD
ncbi:hypothetical protein E2542_SST06750 [Spatholobus suberectus]|nr:hypothetical protein E2542_SST06750 [Spatholobus suberectus]